MYEQFDYVTDEVFLKKLDKERNKRFYVEIIVLDRDEIPIQAIQGKVSQGTISINGDSAVRRTCQLTYLIENRDTAYTEINYLLSLNRKVKVIIGIENTIDDTYGNIIGFPQGIFVISQISLNHSTTGVTVNMSCKDKMCLLNGECGGTLPTSVTFDSYDQVVSHKVIESEADLPNPNNTKVSEFIIYKYPVEKTDSSGETYYTWEYRQYDDDTFQSLEDGADYLDSYKTYSSAPYTDGETISVPQRIYDIIQTAVINFGGESSSNVFINDVTLKLKQLVRWTGSGKLYFNSENLLYSTDVEDTTEIEGLWRTFDYNNDVGYEWVDFTYPGELVSGIGENVCSVLDKIKSALGNYEYFYDVNGHFIFQEKKNYLNTTYDSVGDNSYRLDAITGKKVSADTIAIYTTDSDEAQLLNEISILDEMNYRADFSQNSKSVYVFDENSGLVSAYSNTPVYSNIKNDYHIWGKNDDEVAIHYHLMIKEKLQPVGQQLIETGTDEETEEPIYELMDVYCEEPYYVRFYDDDNHYDGQLYLSTEDDENAVAYYTTDWRAELYMQGLEESSMQQRPNIYKQELLDLFDAIYNFEAHSFRADIVTNPNELTYWFDFLEPVDGMDELSVDNIGIRTECDQEDNVIRLFDYEAPDVVLINVGADAEDRADSIARCRDAGVSYSNVPNDIYENITVGTVGYSAQEIAREDLYQYTTDNNSITIQCVPIYHLEVNNRITVRDVVSDIAGDYIIKSISLPLDARSMMSITASAALTRI